MGQVVKVGGWECASGKIAREARWFSVTLDKKSTPWAVAEGEHFRMIASLELFAMYLCVVLLWESWPKGNLGKVRLAGIKGNLGNTFAVSKMMTSKFPLVVILSELAIQMRDRGMILDLEWTPRDQNEEADALTSGDFFEVTAGSRIEAGLGNIE